MNTTDKNLIGLALYCILSITQTYGQTPLSSDKPIVLTVEQLLELQRIENLKPAKPYRIREEFEFERKKSINKEASTAPSSGVATKQGEAVTAATQTIHSNFLGTLLSETGSFPPDNNGAVGPTQVVIAVNGSIKIFPKTGVTDAATTTVTGNGNTPLANTFSVGANVFFSGVREAGGFTSDVHVRYDRLSGRWFIICIDVNTSQVDNRLLVAVSSGSSITNSSSFTFFQIAHNIIAPAGDANTFFDYPTLGIDNTSLYIGANIFGPPANPSFLGCNMYVINKANLIAASPSITGTAFRNSVTTSDIYTPQGVDNDDPNATEGYFIGVSTTLYSRLIFKRITYPGGVPTISADLGITVSTTSSPRSVPNLGGATALDGIDDRLFAAMVMKNKNTGVSTLWTAHHFNTTAAGVASGTTNRNASRWYQIENLTATPSVTQFGTVFDAAASNPKNYWFPAIAATGQGHAVMIMCSAGAANNANIEVAGRYSTDASGVMQAPVAATTATSAYSVGNNRWGDYAQVVVDPDDNMTMWGFSQYANSTNTYGVRAVQLKAPAPPQTLAASLPSVGQCGASVPLTITGTAGVGTNQEFFDPGSGYTKRLAASIVSPSAIVVNSVTFNTITQITALVNTTDKAAGTYNVTVTNPDRQTTTGTFTMGSCTCTTVSPLPTSVSVNKTVICSGANVTLVASCTDGAVTWYNQLTGGTAIGTGNGLVQSPTSSATYYASCESSNGCKSTRVSTNFVLVGTPAPTLTLTTNFSTGSTFQIANQDINATNKILSPASAFYKAGTFILLNAGFEANTGSIFKAEIGGCN